MATLIMVVGVIVLLRSLNNHLRKVRLNPPAEDEASAQHTSASETSNTEA